MSDGKSKKKPKKKASTKKWKKTPDELLRQTRYPRATQWCVDYDYIHKLSEEDKMWLAQFTDMVYNNADHTEYFGIDDPRYMKEIYKNTNKRNQDLHQRLKNIGLLDCIDDEGKSEYIDNE